MARKSISMIPIVFVVCSGILHAQTPHLHQLIQETYSFEPHLLDKNQQQEKSKLLDQFWDRANANKSESITGLRVELANPTNPPFFLFDGSMLLLSLSDTHEDRVIALAAFARCNLKDVVRKAYFDEVHREASLGENTTAAAFHILEDAKFSIFIPQHYLTLDQGESLVYMLLPTDDEFWVHPAIDRLKTEEDQTAQKSLIRLLWYAQTDAADSALAAFAAESSKPAANRKDASDGSHHLGLAGNALAKTLTAGISEDSIRMKRRERMKAVSDEALDDVENYTLQIAAKRK